MKIETGIAIIAAFILGATLGFGSATLCETNSKPYLMNMPNGTKVLIVPEQFDAMPVLNEFNMVERFDDYRAGVGDVLTPMEGE